jgi:TRAP-type transport system periplasmic protein
MNILSGFHTKLLNRVDVLRSAFRAILMAIFVLLVNSGSVSEAQARELQFRMAHPFAPNTGLGTWMINFAKQLNNRLGMKMVIYPAGALGNFRNVYTAVKSGAVELALLPAETIALEVPDFQIMSVPGLLVSAEDAKRIIKKGDLLEKLNKSASQQGITAIGLGWTFWNLASNNNGISNPNDLKGRKIRVNSLHIGKLMQMAGATPVSVRYSEIFSALQTGYIDSYMTTGTGWGLPAKNGGPRNITWSTEFNIAPRGYVIIMNSRLWNRMGKFHSPIIELAQKTGVQFQQFELDQETRFMTTAMQRGSKVVAVSDSEKQQWSQLTDAYIRAYIDRVPSAANLIDLFR